MPFYLEQLSWSAIILRLVMSLVAGMLIGLERKISNHPAGMKTHAIVCIGAALSSLITTEMAHSAVLLGLTGDARVDISRIASGVLTGIGFVGAGAIMKSRDGVIVTGLTTAATLWVTACLGLSIGMGYLKMSLVALLTVFIANIFLRYLEIKLRLSTKHTKGIIVSTRDKTATIALLDKLFIENKVTVEEFELAGDHRETDKESGIFTMYYTVKLSRTARFDFLLREIATNEQILRVAETAPLSK